ncbi:hypothetical protein [Neomoorella mulderi]|uniref:hypothetical protein n=1 Tax=Neomoorella mulderi TaxID=202604 RepID=UPI000A7B8559|nr:hypothetical protein [Moorella mulderi]
MLGSEKAFIQGYNPQAAADADSQIIVAAEVTNNAADSPHLVNLIEQAEKNTGQSPQEVSLMPATTAERISKR